MNKDKKDPIILYPFSEALEKIKKGEISALIRLKWVEASYDPRIIKMWLTENIRLEYSCVSGNEKCLWHWVRNSKGEMSGSRADVPSSDILAEDYIDTRQWILSQNREDFDKVYKQILADKEKEREEELNE